MRRLDWISSTADRDPAGAAATDSPEALILLALSLWDDDCALYAAAHGLEKEEAAARLEQTRQTGRIPMFSA